MSKDFCQYCGKEKSYKQLIDLSFYVIGDLACKRCAKERLDEIVNHIIPLVKQQLK